jgi:hypothetical protein
MEYPLANAPPANANSAQQPVMKRFIKRVVSPHNGRLSNAVVDPHLRIKRRN